jgi:hypothetical protein
MGPEVVVIPVTPVDQALGLSHRGEQLGVEHFIPESAIEDICKAVLPRRAWLDVSGCGAAVLAPAPQNMGMNSGPLSLRMHCGATRMALPLSARRTSGRRLPLLMRSLRQALSTRSAAIAGSSRSATSQATTFRLQTSITTQLGDSVR